jgi:two-component sensor histidine kinase/integral membrane sensor domain MASE1
MSQVGFLESTLRKQLLLYVALPLAYVICGRLGLLLAVPPGFATAVFLPAGIAVTAMFVAGSGSLPGTLFGSFLLNIWISYSIGHQLDVVGVNAALIIALSSMIQAAVGGALMRKLIGYPASFDNLRDLLLFLLLAPVICLISATSSLSGLRALGIVPATDLIGNWITWWVGDTLGVLVALPLMLVLVGEPQPLWRSRTRFVAVPMVLCFALFVAIFMHVNRWESEQSLSQFRWAVLAAGALSTGLLGGLLLLGTGHAYRLEKLAQQLGESETRIAADLLNMTRLQQVSNHLMQEGGQIEKSLDKVIETAVAISGANKGYLEFLNPGTGTLMLAAQRGFNEPSLKLFQQIQETSGAGSAHRMIIEDLQTDGKLSAQLSRGLADTGVRAVTATPLLSSTGNVLGIVSTLFDTPHQPGERELRLMDLLARQTADYLERKHAEKIQKTLIGEIQHRSNNLLAIIHAIAHLSFAGERSSSEAGKAFEARLQALGRANQELIKSNWAGVNLKEIVRLELEAFADRTLVEGTDIRVGPQLAQNFSLALHELATNAAKYGALSDRNGKVGIYWTIVREGESNRLKLKWQERGGPQVAQPTRRGFGTTLLRAIFPDARFDYAMEGLHCEIEVLLKPGEPDAEAPQRPWAVFK